LAVFANAGCSSKKTDAEIYSAPNSVKIMRDESYADKGEAAFCIETAKNEYEGAQIIVTPKRDVTFTAVLSGDLKSQSGARIFAENVEIFAMHYIEVTEPTTDGFGTGFYPDALVPMQSYVDARHNTIAKNQNQGIYLLVKTNANTPAGIYTGSVKLVLGNDITDIPVRVTVWDFTLPEQTHTRSAFLIWTAPMPDMLIAGEADSSIEMYKTYYEYLLDHRISAAYLPTYAYESADEFVKVARAYAARPDVTCYSLYGQPELDLETGGYILDAGQMEGLLRALIEGSTSELDLLKKAYIYFPTVDEPRSSNDFKRVKKTNDIIDHLKTKLAAEYDISGKFKECPELRQSLANFRHVVTSMYTEDNDGSVDTFCPTIDHYDNPLYRYDIARTQADVQSWWYTCVTPVNPYPSYHVDDRLESSRIISWMQKKYKVDGNLYWSVNIYKKYSDVYSYRDIWNDPLAFSGANGDGYLLYPGADYGVYGPIGTVRLESIRDGLEDYEYLWLLARELDRVSEEYGIEIDFNEYLANLFDGLFTGTVPVADSAFLQAARREVAGLIAAAKNGVILHIKGINAAENLATVELYTKAVDGVTLNDTSLKNAVKCGSGYKYTAAIALTDGVNYAALSAGGIDLKRVISGKISAVSYADANGNLSGVTATRFSAEADTVVSINTDYRYIAVGTDSLRAELKPAGNLTYIRRMTVGAAPGGGELDLRGVGKICLSAFTDNQQPVMIAVRLTDKDNKTYSVNSFLIEPGKLNRIAVNIMGRTSIDMSHIKEISFVFPAVGTVSGADFNSAFNVYFDNIYFEHGVK
jgi:hypothetical protein